MHPHDPIPLLTSASRQRGRIVFSVPPDLRRGAVVPNGIKSPHGRSVIQTVSNHRLPIMTVPNRPRVMRHGGLSWARGRSFERLPFLDTLDGRAGHPVLLGQGRQGDVLTASLEDCRLVALWQRLGAP